MGGLSPSALVPHRVVSHTSARSLRVPVCFFLSRGSLPSATSTTLRHRNRSAVSSSGNPLSVCWTPFWVHATVQPCAPARRYTYPVPFARHILRLLIPINYTQTAS